MSFKTLVTDHFSNTSHSVGVDYSVDVSGKYEEINSKLLPGKGFYVYFNNTLYSLSGRRTDVIGKKSFRGPEIWCAKI
jgi:hypothetical protein